MIKLRVAKRDEERQEYIQSLIKIARQALEAAGLPGDVQGRPKHLYGIYQKMERQSITFEEVYDLTAIRIITDSNMNCYAILGLIHSLWPPVPARFKDYVATPRTNLYQSLHTTVVGPQGEYVEFQIRTDEMHRINEYGVAAHWRYKELGQVSGKDEKVFSWLRQFVEWHKDLTDNRQFMDSVKLDLFHDVVFIFTPKGEVKRNAGRSNSGRFCLCHPYGNRRSLYWGKNQRKTCPIAAPANEWRYVRNFDFAVPGAP